MNDGGGVHVAVDSISGKCDWVYLHDSLLGSAENPGAQGVDSDSAVDAEQCTPRAAGMPIKEKPRAGTRSRAKTYNDSIT